MKLYEEVVRSSLVPPDGVGFDVFLSPRTQVPSPTHPRFLRVLSRTTLSGFLRRPIFERLLVPSTLWKNGPLESCPSLVLCKNDPFGLLERIIKTITIVDTPRGSHGTVDSNSVWGPCTPKPMSNWERDSTF